MPCACGYMVCPGGYRGGASGRGGGFSNSIVDRKDNTKEKLSSPSPVREYAPTGPYALDLDYVVQQMVKRRGWTRYRALDVCWKYKDFLVRFMHLNEADAGRVISPPTQDIDDFWHQHILNTERYAKDCMDMFGFFLHHDPTVDINEKGK